MAKPKGLLLEVGRFYATGDDHVYQITGFNGVLYAAGTDHADGSQRLFYPDGQYVGGTGGDRDVIEEISALRRAA